MSTEKHGPGLPSFLIDLHVDGREMRLEAGMISSPTELFLPEPRAWAAEAADWSAATEGLP